MTGDLKCLMPLPDHFSSEVRFRRLSAPFSPASSPGSGNPIPPPPGLTTLIVLKPCASSRLRYKPFTALLWTCQQKFPV